MDTNELRSLHEAYLDVYRGEQLYEEVTAESYDRKGQGKLLKKMQSLAKPDPDSTVKQNQKRRERSDKMYDKNLTSYVRPKGIPGGVGGPEWKSRQNKERGTQKEEVSVYDIVLSHLLDEGYAETVESAEGIMVNMSEEWRDSIVEEVLDEGYKELPVDKMIAKSKSLTKRTRKPGAPRWEKEDERASKIRKTAGTHSRAAVRKVEKANKSL